MGRARGKLRAAGPHSTKVPMVKDTHSPTHSTSAKGNSPTSYADQIRMQKLKYEPSFEKTEKLRELKDALKEKHIQSEERIGLSYSATSSPSVGHHFMAPPTIAISLPSILSKMITLKKIPIPKP